MAPKKAAVTEAEVHSSESSSTDKKEKKPDAASVRKAATHPSTAVMVKQAIKALDSRKGVSSVAIQNYIKQQYPSVDLLRLKGLLRKALRKGLENGTLVRPASATATPAGATGRFRLAKTAGPKAKSENVDPNTEKAPKAEKDEAKVEPKIKKPAAKKEEKGESSKSKKDDASSSKVAPVKKPKMAKKAAETEKAEDSNTVKPPKKARVKAVKGDEEEPEKAAKAQKGKAKAVKSKVKDKAEAPAKAQGKRGKKATATE